MLSNSYISDVADLDQSKKDSTTTTTTSNRETNPTSITYNFTQYLPFYDAYQLYQKGCDYILSEGYDRSKTTGVGVIDPLPLGNIFRNLPLISWAVSYFIPRIYVISATQHNLAAVASYGEKITDKRAREPHDRVEQATGATTIVNQVGSGAVQEKKKIIKNLSSQDAFYYAKELGNHIADLWQDELSLQDNITYVGAKIIGKCFLGINEFPRKYVPFIRKANDLIADGQASSAEFAEMKNKIIEMSDEILGSQAQEIITANAYVRTQFDLNGNETPQEASDKLKASHGGAGFIVESNLSFILMVALAHISTSSDILDSLVDEIKDKEINTPNDLKNLVYLDCIYRETLRFASPTAVVPRVASVYSSMELENKNGEKFNCSIYPNSYLFFAIRSNHHDAELWKNPEIFNPQRFMQATLNNEMRFIGKNYFPFSAGKRGCPAGSSFVEYAFKGFLIEFFKQYKLILDQPLESIPASAIHPRWSREYFAQLDKDQKNLPSLSKTGC
jgi:hypothetical protein